MYFAGSISPGTGVTTLYSGGITGYNEGTSNLSLFFDFSLAALADIGRDVTAGVTNYDSPEIFGATTAVLTDGTYQVLIDGGWDFNAVWDGDGLSNGGYPTLILPVTVPAM